MGYFKIKDEDYVIGINTVNQIETGNITEAEYLQLTDLFRNRPNGKVILENDGVFSYVDDPNHPDSSEDSVSEEEDKAEAFDILIGGES